MRTSVDLEPGDSSVQRSAETVILRVLSANLGVALESRRLAVADGVRVDVDGVCESSVPPVLVEVWAHQGRPRPAQKAKVMTDALKLVWIERCLFPAGARKILALADKDAADYFLRRTWMSSALRDLGIEVIVVPLPSDLRSQITAAQTRQFR